MICHCGKPTWLYDPATFTCKDGHHTPVTGVTVERIAPPEPPIPARWTPGPRLVAVASGFGSSVLLFLLEHVF